MIEYLRKMVPILKIYYLPYFGHIVVESVKGVISKPPIFTSRQRIHILHQTSDSKNTSVMDLPHVTWVIKKQDVGWGKIKRLLEILWQPYKL